MILFFHLSEKMEAIRREFPCPSSWLIISKPIISVFLPITMGIQPLLSSEGGHSICAQASTCSVCLVKGFAPAIIIWPLPSPVSSIIFPLLLDNPITYKYSTVAPIKHECTHTHIGPIFSITLSSNCLLLV